MVSLRHKLLLFILPLCLALIVGISAYSYDVAKDRITESRINLYLERVAVNTANILFICGGAFDGIDSRIGSRLNTQAIGYKKSTDKTIDKKDILQYVAPQDLKSYGLIPELIGRMPILTHLKSLDKKALREILTEPKRLHALLVV